MPFFSHTPLFLEVVVIGYGDNNFRDNINCLNNKQKTLSKKNKQNKITIHVSTNIVKLTPEINGDNTI